MRPHSSESHISIRVFVRFLSDSWQLSSTPTLVWSIPKTNYLFQMRVSSVREILNRGLVKVWYSRKDRTERPRLKSTLPHDSFFLKTTITPCTVEILYFALPVVRAHGSLTTIIRNARETKTAQQPISMREVSLPYNKYSNYRKSRPLGKKSERAKYLCHTISIVITGNPDHSRINQNAWSIFAI